MNRRHVIWRSFTTCLKGAKGSPVGWCSRSVHLIIISSHVIASDAAAASADWPDAYHCVYIQYTSTCAAPPPKCLVQVQLTERSVGGQRIQWLALSDNVLLWCGRHCVSVYSGWTHSHSPPENPVIDKGALRLAFCASHAELPRWVRFIYNCPLGSSMKSVPWILCRTSVSYLNTH